MSWVGGKARGASHIIAILNHPFFNSCDYFEPFAGMAPLAGSHAQFHASSRQFRSSAAVPFARLLPEISWLERGDVYLEAGSASILAALRGRLAQAQKSQVSINAPDNVQPGPVD